MIKPVSKVFKEQFLRELATTQKSVVERVIFDPYIIHQDAAVIRWTSQVLQKEYKKNKKQ